MPSSSSGISGSCASCAAGPAGSLSAPRSKVSRLCEKGSALPLGRASHRRSSSATANGSSIPSMPRRWIASARPPPYELREVLYRHQQPPDSRRPVRPVCRSLPDNPYGAHTLRPSLTTPRRSRAVLSSGPMSAKIPRPRRKNSRRVFVSGQRRGVVHPLGASCAAAPQSSPSSGYAG